MLPGHVQSAGGYYMIESGSCGGGLVSTRSECEAAARALDLSDQTAYDRSSSTYESYPPGCWQQLWRVLLVRAVHLHVHPAAAAAATAAAAAAAVAAALAATTTAFAATAIAAIAAIATIAAAAAIAAAVVAALAV
eukprot:scaffold102489_cov41-Phaeocystis_antarctica.AAC.1